MNYLIKVRAFGDAGYFAAEQITDPNAEYDATEFTLSSLLEGAAQYETRELAQAEIARLETLFQNTQGVHVSWVSAHATLETKLTNLRTAAERYLRAYHEDEYPEDLALAQLPADEALGILIDQLSESVGGEPMIPMILHCPSCNTRHLDVGEFATKPHHTHACQNCGTCWRPAIEPTTGVQFLPGFKNEPDELATLKRQHKQLRAAGKDVLEESGYSCVMSSDTGAGVREETLSRLSAALDATPVEPRRCEPVYGSCALPSGHKGQHSWGTNLPIQIPDLPIQIPDLRADAEGISGHLSFNFGYVFCMVPWRRVYVLVGREARIWPLDVPISVRLTDLEQDYGIQVDQTLKALDLEFPVAPPARAWSGFDLCEPAERRADLRVIDGGRAATPRPSARRIKLRSVPCGAPPAPVQNMDDQFPDPPRWA